MHNGDWRLLADGLPIALTVKNAHDRRYVFLNECAHRLFGDNGERIGRTDDELNAPDAYDVRKREDEALERKKPVVFLHELVSPTVGTTIVRHSLVPLNGGDGTPTYIVATLENLTEIKSAERLYSAIAESTPIPFAIARVDNGEVVYCNAPFAALFDTTPDQMIGRKTPDLYYNPEDRQIVLQKLATEGRIRDFELRLKRSDGTPFWALIHEKLEEIGGIKYIVAGIIDISKRKAAEARAKESELRAKESEKLAIESERRLRELTAGVPGIIYQAVIPDHGDALFTFVSSGIKKLFNLEPREVEANPDLLYSRLNTEDFRRLKRATIEAVATGKPIALEARYKMPNGRTGWVSIVANPFVNESGEKVVNGLMLDITDRKKAEFELQKNRAVLSEALAAARLAVWELDFASMSLTLDERHIHTIGAKDGLGEIPLDAYCASYVHPEDRAMFYKSMTAATESREGMSFEYRIRRSNGETFYISLTGRAVRDSDGNVSRIVGTMQDVTERKRVELERYERQLRLE
ncbi:MAG: PAS domain S-box protein, partial [Bacteroidia bacterium]|nr:PAS domain S-box protein [Bacteroidia bacterium]MDW8334855.1 PAS domain S-box protein [Bacteroidia bacterium]